MCYADANRVLKEQSMVVRRTETRDFGLATGWSEDDGTTTTYQPHARAVTPRGVGKPAPRAFQPSALAPAMAGTPSLTNVYAQGARKHAAPAIGELALDSSPFARRRSTASASAWNALGFAGLFASVLIGRVIVQAGHEHARATETPPQPTAASAHVGAAGVGAEAPSADRRNEAALAAPESERGAGPQPNDVASELPSRTRPSTQSPHARAARPQADWRDGPIEPAQLNAASAATPLPAASASQAELGTLRINSRPWSQVFLDGRLIGATPQMNVRVPAGRYSVRLANPELGMSKTFVIHVAVGELVTRVETLE